MPFIKSRSNKARSENIKTEIEAGKPPAQAEAIGYAVQRRATGESPYRHAAKGKAEEDKQAASHFKRKR